MMVIDFLLQLENEFTAAKFGITPSAATALRKRCKNIRNEDVLAGGNDMYLAAELNINRQVIEDFVNKKYNPC